MVCQQHLIAIKHVFVIIAFSSSILLYYFLLGGRLCIVNAMFCVILAAVQNPPLGDK